MKIASITVVINEEDYIYYALKAAYDAVDSIIVVEGAARRRFASDAIERGLVTAEGLSGDGTQSEIERFMLEDVKRKVTYVRHGWTGSVNELRQIALGCVSLDTDYCLVLDGDSLYLSQDIQRLREIVSRNGRVWMISCTNLMFFMDMDHLLVVDQDKLEICNYMDSGFFWKFLPEVFMKGQRPYLIPSGDGTEKMENVLTRVVSEKEAASSHDSPPCYLCSYENSLPCYHFGWVHSQGKTEGHLLRVAHAQLDEIKKGKLGSWSRDFEQLVGAADEEILEWYRTYHKIWTGLYDEKMGERLVEFDGIYPEAILEHPYFGKSRIELGWKDKWE